MAMSADSASLEVVVEKRSSPAAVEESNTYEKLPEVDDSVKKEDEPILPDHYYDDGKIPVFKPTMDQFRSFKDFVRRIDHYGMQSGIVKIIPPAEWRDTLPKLETKVKEIRVKNPIVQHIAGTGGVYRQTNLEKQKMYNLPQWRNVCESSDHQPPAKRGERRKNQEAKVTRGGRGRGTRSTRRSAAAAAEEEQKPTPQPLTPPPHEKEIEDKTVKEEEDVSTPAATEGGRQPKPRKKYVRKTKEEVDDMMDSDPLWENFDYNLEDVHEYTKERCEDLERAYWRTLTYNSPLYGADMPGSLFDDNTTSWNVAKLENILDSLGKKLPGVNTAYLYLGMWKSTFAWHLEDVDLYSINYIHFGAPKQWYSISQEDAPRFHQIMKSIWPNEAKKCDQFLRHKTFLVSPSILESQHKLKVNKLVHNEGEFVITFPYGYHSGYNLGYNCAESVNFATEAWLDYGRKAKKCECVDDAVWVDVDEVERKMRGEPTEDEWSEGEQEEDEEEEDDGMINDLPTPPESVEGADVKRKEPKKKRPRKRKADDELGSLGQIKKVKLKFSVPAPEPCILCPNDIPSEDVASTDNGKQAHRLCAIYTPETYFGTDPETGKEVIHGFDAIPKARLDLKCFFCRSKKGACFQCSEKKCIRAYHATCAAAAGVLVDMRHILAVDGDGLEYESTEMDFRCRFHRPKRGKELDGDKLEESPTVLNFARAVNKGDVIQMQFYRGDIFAGVVIENRVSEAMVLVEVLPSREKVEIEWKWILAHDSTQPSSNTKGGTAKSRQHGKSKKGQSHSTSSASAIPRSGDMFHPSAPSFTWSEYHSCHPIKNVDQESAKQFWYYLGELSTENIPKYSEDPDRRIANDAAIMSQKKLRTAGESDLQMKPYPPASTGWVADQAGAGYQAYWNQYQKTEQSKSNASSQPPHTQWWQQSSQTQAYPGYSAEAMAYYQSAAEALLSQKQRELLREQKLKNASANGSVSALAALSAVTTPSTAATPARKESVSQSPSTEYSRKPSFSAYDLHKPDLSKYLQPKPAAPASTTTSQVSVS